MSDSSKDVNSITLNSASISLHSTNEADEPQDNTSYPIAARSPQQQQLSRTGIDQQHHSEPSRNNPQGHSGILQEANDSQLSTADQPPKDAWADQGHFPLLLGDISCRSIPIRGGATVVLSGVNFREGVEVLFECATLNLKPKKVTPKVLKSTEMELVSPNLLDWWTTANNARPCRELCLSITLLCAGAKAEEDIDTTLEVVATEESEIDLLHVIIGLHRQLVKASLSSTLDHETENITRQRTLTLLKLEQPPSVTRTEHLALGVIYMLCAGHDHVSAEGMEVILATTVDGHDMLHLAVIQGQTTLVREIARHLLSWFQSRSIMEESELLAKDPNGKTALDFARILGYREIEEVLEETVEVAQEFKRSALQATRRPLPTLPARGRLGSTAGSTGSTRSDQSTLVPPIPVQVANRPLPPTPLTSPYQEEGSDTYQPLSYFPVASAEGSTISSPELRAASHEPTAPTGPAHSPAQRIQTAQAIIEDDGTSQTVYESSSAYSNTVQYGIPTMATESIAASYHGQQNPLHEQHAGQQHHFYQQPQPHQTYPFLSQSPTSSAAYTFNPHSIPPPRANTAPLSHISNSPQGQHSAQAAYLASEALFRELPAAPSSSGAPLPPPKHIVTRVNRPKQHTLATIPRANAAPPYPFDGAFVPTSHAYTDTASLPYAHVDASDTASPYIRSYAYTNADASTLIASPDAHTDADAAAPANSYTCLYPER
ncbi:hypothetical protein BGZ54_000372 [Gamsiella multidivaricata]|nr:hypothetical protein BGZ54_000372 [Gamsiella multidivaricata]